MIVHCLFEQSGTFKNEFKKLGFDAYDYDILNDFGETDYIVDLFENIRWGHNGEPSIFDNVRKEDLMIAFFPCIRFENQAKLHFRCDAPQYAKYTMVEKLEHDIRLQKQLSELYDLVSMLAIIAYRRGLRLIIENPYSKEHYLHSYWCLKPTIIDYDRRENGDYFKKPTQYYFINIEPKQNVLFEAIKQMQINDTRDAIRQISNVGIIENLPVKSFTHRKDQTARSMISAQYANRFIRQYIL